MLVGSIAERIALFYAPHRAIIDSVRFSIGEALIDTIDDMINEGRIEPQLALKILLNYDRCISEALSEKVKSRLTFKVRLELQSHGDRILILFRRAISRPTDSATMSGPS